jgi:hypothetical protein
MHFSGQLAMAIFVDFKGLLRGRANQSGAFPPDGMADFNQQEHWIDGDELASKERTCPGSIFYQALTSAVLDRR